MSYTLGVYYELEKGQNMIVAKKSKIKPHWRVIINSVLILVCVVLFISIGELIRGYYSAKERLHYVKEAHDKSLDQFNDLKQELTDLTTPDGLEYYVRNHYRALAEGENIVVVVDPQKVKTKPAEPKPTLFEKIRIFLQIP